MRLNEFKFERDLESKIDEFGILSDKIDKVKMELSELSNRYKEIEGELRPTLEQLIIQNKKSIQTKRYLVTLKRMVDDSNFKSSLVSLANGVSY
jgi:hypothetical protein